MTHPNLYEEIHHRYSGTVKVKHSTQAMHAVDAHRAFLAYSRAAEAIGALLVKYAADIETEAANRKAFAEEKRIENEAKVKEIEAQIAVEKANPPAEPMRGFWGWLEGHPKEDWRQQFNYALRLSRLDAERFDAHMTTLQNVGMLLVPEETQALRLQDKLEEKSHLAYVVEGALMLTTQEAIEMSKAEDGTLAEEIEKTFTAMAMRNGALK